MHIKQLMLLVLILNLTFCQLRTISYPFQVLEQSRVTVVSITSQNPLIITNSIFSPKQQLIVTLKGNETTYVSTVEQQINNGKDSKYQQIFPDQYIAKDATYQFVFQLEFNYCLAKHSTDTIGTYTISYQFTDYKYRKGQTVANIKFNLKLDTCITDKNACPDSPCPKNSLNQSRKQYQMPKIKNQII